MNANTKENLWLGTFCALAGIYAASCFAVETLPEPKALQLPAAGSAEVSTPDVILAAQAPPDPQAIWPIEDPKGRPKAFFFRGDALLAKCAEEDIMPRAMCFTFIAGVDDTFTLLLGADERMHCANRKLGGEAYVRAYIGYMQTHPELLEEPASQGVMQALRATFSCPPAPPKPSRTL